MRKRGTYDQAALLADQAALRERSPERAMMARQASKTLKELSAAQQLEFDFFGGGNVVEWHFMDAVESIELATRPSSSVRILPIGVSADDEAAFSDQSASRDALLEMIK